jgi:TonB family protein
VVLSRWVLGLDDQARALVFHHEREHIRAGDPWLLHAAVLVVIGMPWNPVVWWMAARLRLAIEIDCDARVVKGLGARSADARQRYGELLLDVAARQNAPQRLFVVPALLERSSTLARRIVAMFPKPTRLAAARTFLAVGAALLLVGAAAITPSPRLLAQAPVVAPPLRATVEQLPLQGTQMLVAGAVQAPASENTRLSYADWTSLFASQHAQLKKLAADTGGFCLCFDPEPTPTGLTQEPPAAGAPQEATPASQSPATEKPDDFGKGALSASDTSRLVVPVPVHKQTPLYSAEAMRRTIQGRIGVDIVVGVDGTVEDARISESLDKTFGLDDAALAAARQWTFEPGTLEGKPVRVLTQLYFDLRLH